MRRSKVPRYLRNGPQHSAAVAIATAALTKPSNPKEAFGEQKMPDGLVPETAIAEENLAFLEGALKYGQYNWRVVGVKASTYRRAIGRHLKKWWNGQDRDPTTMVLELASVRACCGIIIDAIAAGKFTDDRPPRADMEKCFAEAAKIAAHLKQLFKDHNPPQYNEREHGEGARRYGYQAFTNWGELAETVGEFDPAAVRRRLSKLSRAAKRYKAATKARR